MKKKIMSLLAFIIFGMAPLFAFGLYRVDKLSTQVAQAAVSYSTDQLMVEKKGDVYIANGEHIGEKIMEGGKPIAEGTLNQSLGCVLEAGNPTTNANGVSETLMGRTLMYSMGTSRKEKGSSFDGYDTYLTLNGTYQTAIYNMLKNTEGQAVLVNYQTGEILASVSVGKDVSLADAFTADTYIYDENGRVVYDEKTANSVTRLEIYPGSTIKPILAAALLELGEEDIYSFEFDCNAGNQTIAEECVMQCIGGCAHGKLTLPAALNQSCNKFIPAYVYTNENMHEELVVKLTDWGMEGDNTMCPINQTESRLCDLEEKESGRLMYIGQGDCKMTLLTLVTPYMALANEGVLVEPHYIRGYSEIGDAENVQAVEVDKHTMMSAQTANDITTILKNTVCKGTGRAIGQEVDTYFYLAVKTGTADYADGETHKLCISYSGNEAYPYVLAVDVPKNQAQATNITRQVWEMLK